MSPRCEIKKDSVLCYKLSPESHTRCFMSRTPAKATFSCSCGNLICWCPLTNRVIFCANPRTPLHASRLYLPATPEC